MNKPPIIRKPVPVRPGEAPALKEQCQDVSGIGEDLWEVARATLDEDVRSIISDEGVEPKDRIHVLKLVLHESNEKRKQCLKQRWKIRKRNGDVIILRDVFEKMIRWVDNFKDISKIVMEFAPSYASIPWGIICILLKASINDTEIFAAMIDGLEKVTCMISRYAIFEIVYFQRPAAASRELKSSLVMLYSSILTFLAHSYHYFGQRASKRFLKSVFESSASDIDDLLAKIETREREVDRVAQLVGIELLHEASDNIGSLRSTTEILSTQMALLNTQFGERGQNALSAEHVLELQQAIAASIGDSTHRIFEPIYRISDQLTVEVRRQIFDWLSSVRYKITHQVERKHRLPDSGTWMFNTPEYQSWINSSVSGTLWLHGMPGCGKTKLASAVVDLYQKGSITQERDQITGQSAFAFFYCSRNEAEPERSKPEEVLRSIARQLCGDNAQLPVNEALSSLYKEMDEPRSGEHHPSLEQTTSLILSVLNFNPAVIVIDALDECDVEKRFALFESLDYIVRESANIVKIFLTSRNDGDIVCRLKSTPNIYINAQSNHDDIQRFIKSEVDLAITQRRMLKGHVSSELQDRIIDVLGNGAQGMFRWVTLQVQNLCDPRRMKMEEDIVRELGNLPKSLADLYSLAFSQILELGGTSFSLALNALQLSISAVCPICWPEFQHLLSNCHNGIKRNPTKEEILDVTCNFLEDNVELDQPRLVHPSTREYLGTRPEFSPGNMNLNVSMLCLRSIKELGLNDVPDFAYSSLYLGRHIAATNTTNRHDLRKYLEELLRPSSKLFKIWRERLAWFYKRRANTGEACIESLLSCDPLFTVCALGLEEYLPFVPCDPIRMQKAFASDFSKKPAELGTKARPYVRVLGYNGSFLMPPEYLTECPDILTDFDKKTCVEVTIMMNRIGIIQRLHGLGINLSRIFNSKGENPLHIAANTGSSEMIQVLLECGLDPNEMTKALGHDTNASRRPPPIYSNRSQTAMGFRTYNSGYSGVSSPFYLSQELQAPLHYCVARDDAVAGVRSLIEHGADVNMRTSSGNTPLQLALNAGGASETFCRLLLDAGADPNAIIGQGQTLLHRVAAMGLEEIVQALYDAGANCWLLDSFGRCPYDLAVRYGHTRIVDILKPDSQIKRTGESDSLSKEDIADPSVSHKPLAFGHGTPDSSQNSEHSGHKIGISDDVKREWSRLNMRMA